MGGVVCSEITGMIMRRLASGPALWITPRASILFVHLRDCRAWPFRRAFGRRAAPTAFPAVTPAVVARPGLLRRARVIWPVAAGLALLAPAPASAQLFFASRPEPPFTVGPLMIRARVDAGVTAPTVSVRWSLVIPASVHVADIAQDLYLLWPGEVDGDASLGKPDPGLAQSVEERGFAIIGEGRLGLFAQSLSGSGGGERAEALPGGAPFVVFVQVGGPLGLSPPATFIRIPWTARLADPGWLMDLHMTVRGLIKPRKATWAERLFLGGRYRLTVGYHEVRDRPLFPMYFAYRDRVVRLADAPAELVVNFAHSDRLKIDEVFPPTSLRRLSETEETTEVVSLFLDKTEGITPQHLAVQFGYFSKLQAWALVLIPALFFVLGQAVGPMLGRTAVRLARAAGARVHLSRWRQVPRSRQTGVILSREVLQKIVPGETTRDEVIRLCGADMEEFEQFPVADRRTLIYRGRRVAPKTRRVLGWVSTVQHWEAERHEVRIELERDVVRDVQAQSRHYRLAAGMAGDDLDR
jgi:hypothetical protein